jgi:alpha-glucosidase
MVLDALTRTLADQVVYEVFPDRFAIGGGRSSADKLASPAYARPEARPWEHDAHGGDLDGVAERLDYLQDLGVTTLYLTPVFQSPSSHKYDATDLLAVDAGFGGEPALERLLAAAHGRGLKLMLDAVLNHVSDRHPWFRAALAGDPAYRGWFTFRGDGGWDAWQDHAGLPELDLARDEVRDALYRSPGSPVQHWLARGVDGWRFDTAQDLGLEVCRELAATVARRFPRAWLVGEICGYGGAWVGPEPCFHGVMNYFLRTLVLGWLQGGLGSAQAHRGLADLRAGYGLAGLLGSWNMLASHDTPRLRTVLGDDARVRLAWLAQMTLPGVPVIYYGEEVGMAGGPDPGNREPMDWSGSGWDRGLLAWVRSLAALRRASPALRRGDLLPLGDGLDGRALVFLRHTGQPGEFALVALNAGERPLRAQVLVPWSHLYDGVPLEDALGRAPAVRAAMGSVTIEIPPMAGAVYQAAEPFRRYAFFKGRNRAAESRE